MIGFSGLISQLKRSVKSETISHAHLITGPDGIGKSVFAKNFAKMIITKGQNTQKENYVDIIEVRNDKLSIGVDEIRKVINESNVKPFEAERKVIIIYQAEKMTVQAQNALLKTLEEPSEGVFFILVSDDYNSLLATIRSRVQTHKLSPLSKEEIGLYLDENFDLNGYKKEELIALSMGIPGNIDRFIYDEKYKNFLNEVFSFLELLSQVKGLRDRNAVKILEKNKLLISYDLEEFFNTVIVICRDLMILKLSQDYKNMIFLYNKEVLDKISQKYSIKRLTQIINISEKGLDLLSPGRNINKETITDYILFRLLEEV